MATNNHNQGKLEDKGEALRGGEKQDVNIREDRGRQSDDKRSLNKDNDTKSGPHQH